MNRNKRAGVDVYGISGSGREITLFADVDDYGRDKGKLKSIGRSAVKELVDVMMDEGFVSEKPRASGFKVGVGRLGPEGAYVYIGIDYDLYKEAMLDENLLNEVIAPEMERRMGISKRSRRGMDVGRELHRAVEDLGAARRIAVAATGLAASTRLLLPFAPNAKVRVSRRRASVVVGVTEHYAAPPMVATDVEKIDKRMERSMNKMMDLIEKEYGGRVEEVRFSPNPHTHLSAGGGEIGFMREVAITGKKDDHDVLMELADELES